MRAIRTIWYREFLNYIRDRARIISSIVMSFTMLFVFTYALGNFDTSNIGANKIQYLLPGIIAITVFTTSLSNALKVVQDKTDGFMKEFLVSPTSRTNIALGKILGGASSAVLQAAIIMIVAVVFGFKYDFLMVIEMLIGMIAIALSISAIGLYIASKIKSTMGFQMIIQMLMMPMMFLSGAYVPISLLPTWIRPIVYLNPITYSVSAFRNFAIDTSVINETILENMGLIFKIGDFVVTPYISIGIILLIGSAFLFLAINAFKKTSITKKVVFRGGGPGRH